tara:strand:- start:344 stop:529 length:186 start_codon:yes stop_codon:yes gene_type:complete
VTARATLEDRAKGDLPGPRALAMTRCFVLVTKALDCNAALVEVQPVGAEDTVGNHDDLLVG